MRIFLPRKKEKKIEYEKTVDYFAGTDLLAA